MNGKQWIAGLAFAVAFGLVCVYSNENDSGLAGEDRDFPEDAYYVSPEGDDAAPGTREAPWRTAGHAGREARAGETVVFLPGDYTDPLIPANSGSPGEPIVFMAAERRQARLIGDEPGDWSQGNGGRILLDGVSHIVIKGFQVVDTAEDRSRGGWLRMNRSAHVTIEDCGFEGGARWAHFFVEGSEQVRVLDSDFARNRYGGDMWRVENTRYLVIEGNSFSRALHTLGSPRNSENVLIRGNVFHSGWSRNFESRGDTVLVENNIFANAYNGGRSAGSMDQLRSDRMIYRFNTTFGAAGIPCVMVASSARTHLHNRTYNNVFHGNHGMAMVVESVKGNLRNMVLKNNIFDRNDPFATGTQLSVTGGGPDSLRVVRNAIFSGEEDAEALILFGRTPLSLDDLQGDGRCSEYAAQRVTRTRSAGDGRKLPVEASFLFVRTHGETYGTKMIAVGDSDNIAGVVGVENENRVLQLDRKIEWEAEAPVIVLPDLDSEEMFSENMEVAPRFAEPGNFDFALAEDSPLLDAAAPLTMTLSSGSGRTVPVEDAYYFYDGFGIEGERGDMVAIGESTNRARVVGVDTEAHVLHLDRELEWERGAAVAFPWSGAGADLGVHEHGAGVRPSVQVVVDDAFPEPGEEVELRVVTRGIEKPVACEWHLGDGTVTEGERVRHRFKPGYDYGIRVRVTDAEGNTYRGVGYVNAKPPQDEEVLIHTTFDADDEDWWAHWQFYRGRRATGYSLYEHVLNEESGRGYHRIAAREETGPLPALLHPRNWNIDRYPKVRIRYRIRPGAPVAIFVRPFPSAYHTLWDMDFRQDSRRYYFAGTGSVLGDDGATDDEDRPRPRGPLPESPMERTLIDDGEWHEIVVDVRDVRRKFPDVDVLQSLEIGDLEIDGGSEVGPDDEFWLDEIYIGR